MRKYTYLYECSLYHRKQSEFKDTQIFSFFIKCDTIIWSNYLLNHLEINGKNHPVFNTEYIIKNNEKFIKYLLHLKEKKMSFCLKCNIHI